MGAGHVVDGADRPWRGAVADAPRGPRERFGRAIDVSRQRNIIAYDIDRLFRGVRPDVNMEYTRAEAGRILLTPPAVVALAMA